MKKKGLVLLGVFAVLCAIIFTCRLWPLFEMKDSEGNIIGDHRGILHVIGPIVDPYYFSGTYVTVEVDKEKLSKTIGGADALKIAYINLRNRCDSIDGPVVRMINDRQILISLPGMKDTSRITDEFLSRNAAKLEFKPVYDKNDMSSFIDGNGKIVASRIPKDVCILKDREGKLEALGKTSFLNGSDITDAKIRFEKFGIYKVWVKFTEEGGKRFADFTGKNIGRKYGIVFDDIVFMIPVVGAKFTGPEGIIISGLPKAEASDLALVLTAGNEIPVKIVDMKVKNPNNTWGVIDGGPINKK